MKKQLILSAAISAIISNMAWANSDEFTLGKITVSGDEVTQKAEATTIDAQEMQEQGLVDVGQALQRVPGVVLDMGGRRAETKVAIRGFDSRQTTVNIDGIPVYLPYDGNIDLSRYLTGELSKIEVQKSLSSLMLGPNNMGGSINLISRKPTKEIEASLTAGIETGRNGIFSNFQSMQLGSKIDEKFYIQAGMSREDRNNFPLSDDYKVKTHMTEGIVQGKGDRVRAKNQSETLNLKFGYTPNETDEYAISYHQVEGSKEAPLYGGEGDGTNQTNPAYWDWPVWDKQSLYFLSHTQFGDTYLKTRVYHDHFDNQMAMYKTKEYREKRSHSQYSDTSYGANIELGSKLGQHLVKGILQAKFDEHKEKEIFDTSSSQYQSWDTYKNEIFSFGLEDRWQISDATAVTFSYRRDQFEVTKTDDGNPVTQPSDKQTANNFQLKAEHKLGEHTLFGGISSKTRYPGIKERYSYRMNQAIPNSNLKAEKAIHYEVGSIGHFGIVDYQANIFYSDIKDAVESVTLTSGPDAGKFQNQNVGTAKHQGLEVIFNINTTDNTRLDLNYSYLDRKLADKSLTPTQSPKHTALVTMNYFPTDSLDLALDIQHSSKRHTTTNGKRPTKGYELVHLRSTYQINKNLRANLALRNAMDKNYETYDGDPMPGRTLWASVTAEF